MSAMLPGRTGGLGLIKEPLRTELAVSDLRFNVLNFWACVIRVGGRIDRLGTRRVLAGVGAALGGLRPTNSPKRIGPNP